MSVDIQTVINITMIAFVVGFVLPVLCGQRRKCDKIRGEEESEMTKRIEITPSPEPLEVYVGHFDDLFGKSNQREEFRRYLEGLLLPTERH